MTTTINEAAEEELLTSCMMPCQVAAVFRPLVARVLAAATASMSATGSVRPGKAATCDTKGHRSQHTCCRCQSSCKSWLT